MVSTRMDIYRETWPVPRLRSGFNANVPIWTIPIRINHTISDNHGNTHLVGGFNLPLWKMMEFVSWDNDIPNICVYIYGTHKSHVPNHQPELCRFLSTLSSDGSDLTVSGLGAHRVRIFQENRKGTSAHWAGDHAAILLADGVWTPPWKMDCLSVSLTSGYVSWSMTYWLTVSCLQWLIIGETQCHKPTIRG